MASEESTFVIDPEFAFYGPMGFDIGALLANILLAYFSQPGRNAGDDYEEWLLLQIDIVWKTFDHEFFSLWTREHEESGKNGELYTAGILNGAGELERAQEAYRKRLWRDTIGFAGAKMIRRIVGIAHVADLESIEDNEVRAVCEKRSLVFGRVLVIASQQRLEGTAADGVAALIALARTIQSSYPPTTWPSEP